MKAAREEAAQKLKAERKAKRKAEKAESLRLAEKRKKKDVKLNQLTSISGGNAKGKTQTNQTCFKCGLVGHMKAECPKRGREDTADDGDRPRKSRKSG